MNLTTRTPIIVGAALVAALLVLAPAAIAQEVLSPNNQSAKVTIAAPTLVGVAPGRPAAFELMLRVAPGFHINSHQPKSDLLIPTVVRLSPPTNISVGRIRYPMGRDLSLPFAPQERLNVYTGDVYIPGLISAGRGTTPGRYRVHGELRYQACDNRACYPPTSVPFSFDVKVGRPVYKRAARNPGQSPHIHR